MKWRLTMAGVLGLAAVPMPAQAAAAVDVVAAVQRLQAEGRAAKIFQYTAADWPYDPRYAEMPRGYCKGGDEDPRMTGTMRLGPGGVVAADMTRMLTFGNCRQQFLRDDAAGGDPRAAEFLKVGTGSHRVRSVGGVLYGAGPAYGGKSWMKLGSAPHSAALYGDQIIDAFDLGTLKALVASASMNKAGGTVHDADDRAVKKTWSYRGTITFSRLFKVSKPFRHMLGGRLNPKYGGITIHWGIATDMSGKPIVVQAVWRPGEGFPLQAATVATRFSWDVNASIKAPRVSGKARDPYGDDVIDLFRS
ncbi:hypothetical protein [Nonomuraea rubra]|uniref:Uncharacterized protein n=2 Tax=Nonomuraea rubra TaxID=46180 RepID=A0A7X0U4K9_9ACTN|nr:hypothetical protein [Nonomuraea rubra]MBB6554639.1 hypothetical protein [Nonomuraea rubra]